MISILKKWWKKWQSNPGVFDEGVKINKRRDDIAKMIASRYSKDDDYGNKTKAYSEGYDEGFADGIKKRNDTIAVAENNGYQRGYAENGDYFYNNGYADGLAQSKQEFHRHAAERYRAGVQDGRNEIVNTINNLRTPE